ncbi:MAG: hypothetical protein ACKO3T_07250 [Planctomycetaceae bacterium]
MPEATLRQPILGSSDGTCTITERLKFLVLVCRVRLVTGRRSPVNSATVCRSLVSTLLLTSCSARDAERLATVVVFVLQRCGF